MTHEQLMQLRHILRNKGYDDSMIIFLFTLSDAIELVSAERICFKAVLYRELGDLPQPGDTGFIMGIRYIVTNEIPHSRYMVRSPSGKYTLEEGWIA